MLPSMQGHLPAGDATGRRRQASASTYMRRTLSSPQGRLHAAQPAHPPGTTASTSTSAGSAPASAAATRDGLLPRGASTYLRRARRVQASMAGLRPGAWPDLRPGVWEHHTCTLATSGAARILVEWEDGKRDTATPQLKVGNCGSGAAGRQAQPLRNEHQHEGNVSNCSPLKVEVAAQAQAAGKHSPFLENETSSTHLMNFD